MEMKTMSEITGTKFPVMSANGINTETERDDGTKGRRLEPETDVSFFSG